MTSIRTLSLPQRGRWVIEADLRKLALDRKRELRPRYCPICDGYEAIDRRIGVVGPFEGAGRKALFLRTYSRDVWLFATDTPQGRSDLEQRLREAGVRVAGKPVRVQRHSCSISITLEGGTHEKLDVLYPAMGCYVRSRLATTLGAGSNDLGNLKVGEHQQTTVDRLYAVGDVVTDLHQLSVAVGHAAIAALTIEPLSQSDRASSQLLLFRLTGTHSRVSLFARPTFRRAKGNVMSTKLACSVVPTMEICPNCKSEMTIMEVTPIFLANGFEDVTYRCKGCRSDIKRTFKRRSGAWELVTLPSFPRTSPTKQKKKTATEATRLPSR